MKKTIYVSLLLMMIAPRFFAQVMSAKNFPIGGMDISTLFPPNVTNIIPDSMKNIGLNTYYLQDAYQIFGGNKYGIAGQLYSNMTMYSGTANYGENLLIGSYCGAKGIFPGTEMRYFLSTTSNQRLNSKFGLKSDYERIDLLAKMDGKTSVWQTIKPYPLPSNRASLPIEWEIFPFDQSNTLYTGDILKLELDDNFGNNSLHAFHDGGNTNLIVDFIFRFGSEAVGTTSTLYTVTVTVFNGDGTTASTTTLPLTESVYAPMRSITYANYNSILNNPNQPFGNPKSLYFFPNNRPTNDLAYSILRLGGGAIDIGGKNKVVITLNRFVDGVHDNTTVPIYIRGFRCRTQMADDILANNYVPNDPLSGAPRMKANIENNFFHPLLNDLQQSQSVWSHTSNINGSTEPTRECFRVLSYIDNLFSNYSNNPAHMNSGFKPKKMNIFSFLTENVSSAYSEYRAIYEDEIGIVPPLIDAEGTFANYEKKDIRSDLSVPVPPFIPRDAILNSIRSITGFTDLGFTIRPYLPSNPSYPETLSDAYTAYTNAWQGSPGITDYKDDLYGYLTFTSNTHEDAARAAIPDPTWAVSEKTKWYAMVTSMSNTIWNDGSIFRPLDEPSVSSQTDLTSFRNTVGNIFIDNSTSSTNPNGVTPGVDVFHQGFDINHILLPGALSTKTYNDKTNGTIWQWGRSPLAVEMRADAWDALAWGAKGIIFNAFGSDGGPNVGICDKTLRGDYDFGTESTKDGLFDQTIGDCTTPFFTADPNVSNAHNYTDRCIIYTGDKNNLPLSGGKRLSAYQRVPITLGTGSTPWERVIQTNLDDFIGSSTNLTLNHNDGSATGSNWGTNPQSMPDPFSDNRFNGPGKWVPVRGGCPNIGILTSTGNFSSGETIKIGANTYTLVTSLRIIPTPIPGEVVVDVAHQDITINNIAACIMNTGGGNYTPWGTGQDQDVYVVAKSNNSLTIGLRLISGSAFSVATSTTCNNATWAENTVNVWESFFSGYPRDDNGTAMPYNCTAGLWYYFPQPYLRMLASVPTFYGFKERWNGARQIVNDINNCANTLKDLNWINTYSLPQVSLSASSSSTDGHTLSTDFNTNTPFQLANLVSRKFDLTTYPLSLRTTQDTNDPEDGSDPILFSDGTWRIDQSLQVLGDPFVDRRLYEIGFFQNKKISYFQQKFAVVANKRTWPYFIDDITTSPHIRTSDGGDALLGPIDRRQFSAYIDATPSKWKDVDPKRLKLFEVLDYRDQCHPQYLHPQSQPFTINLDPGEGTLLCFAPVFGLPQVNCRGVNNNNAKTRPINNSRHISSLEADPTNQSFQMTYVKEGGVAVSYPTEGFLSGDSSLAKRHLSTPSDSLIDSNVQCHDPAIAANAEIPTSLGIVYCIDSTGTGSHPDSTTVIFRHAAASTPYAYSADIVLDKYKTLGIRTTATPAITPAKSGCGKWWVSWRNPMSGGVIALLDTSGTVISKKHFSAGDPTSTRFISITSHLYRDLGSSTPQSDTCFMAFEEGAHATSQIYYLEAFCNGSGIDTTGLKNISKGLPYCENHYPCIAMTPTHRVMTTWEAISQKFTWADSLFVLHRTHYGILHGRYADNSWTSYLTLMGFDVPMTDSLVDTLSMYPVVSVSDWKTTTSTDTTWDDLCRYVWHSPFDEQVHISHFGYMNGAFIPCFENVMMPDASLWPSLPERKMFNGVLQPLMYVHPTYAADTSYSPQVTIYDFPISTLVKAAVLKQKIVARPLAAACGGMLIGSVGQALIQRDTSLITVNW